MTSATPGPRALLHPGFIGAGSALLTAALGTDAMYGQTALMQWANFSAWLITAGLVLALVAALILIVDFATGRAGRISWPPFLLSAAAVGLSTVNVLVHSRDAWTSVMPLGITLSAVVSVLLLVAAVGGWRVTTARMVDEGDRP